MRDCLVYVRKIAIVIGVVILINYDDNRINREVNRLVMDDACFVVLFEEIIK